jgi:hypothetical protein
VLIYVIVWMWLGDGSWNTNKYREEIEGQMRCLYANDSQTSIDSLILNGRYFPNKPSVQLSFDSRESRREKTHVSSHWPLHRRGAGSPCSVQSKSSRARWHLRPMTFVTGGLVEITFRRACFIVRISDAYGSYLLQLDTDTYGLWRNMARLEMLNTSQNGQKTSESTISSNPFQFLLEFSSDNIPVFLGIS